LRCNGVTYKAFDVDLHCPVTLKVISERYLGDESARLRFLREARAAASRSALSSLNPGDRIARFCQFSILSRRFSIDAKLQRYAPLRPSSVYQTVYRSL
jgi:hypothetical protein